MLETIILISIWLAVFLCLRGILDGKIPARLQYAVWLVIALRLLFVWVPLPESRVSVMNLLSVAQESFQSSGQDVFEAKSEQAGVDVKQETALQGDAALLQKDTQEKDAILSQDIGEQTKENSAQSDGQQMESKSVDPENGSVVDWKLLLYRIYGIGASLVLVWIIAKNLYFWNGLRRRRIRYEGELPVSSLPGNVYLLEHLKSPFLFGRHIYVSPEMMKEEQKLKHILVHESCHWKQGDSFWSVLRCLCLVLYWYHPLVWCGVHFSIVDAELACDERAIRILGEESRHGYGDTLLGLIRKQAAYLECTCISTQMSGNKAETKKRLERIVERRKERRGRILFLVISMLILCLATLPGEKNGKADAATEKEWQRVEQEGFPCIVVDEQGNIVGTKRGELLQKVILNYTAGEGADIHNYQIQAKAFSACPNLKTLILPSENTPFMFTAGKVDFIAPDAFQGCSEDLVVYCEKESYAWSRLRELNIKVKRLRAQDTGLLFGEDTAEMEQIQKKIDAENNNRALTDREMRQCYGEPFFVMTESGEVLPSICVSLWEYTLDRQIYLPSDANTLAGTFPQFLMTEYPITIPKNIVEIGDSTFLCTSLAGLDFEEGSKLQKIGNQAFMQTAFTELQLPEGLQEIGESAFDMCNNLTTVTIPESVKTIGSHCFRLSDALERVVILNPDVSIGEDIFDDEILNPELKEDEVDMDDLDSNFIPNNRLTIVCHKGSTAEKYAQEHGLQVEYLE